MSKWTFLELSRRILREENRPLSSEEIWIIAVKKGYDKQINSQGKTPWRTIGAQIYLDMRDNDSSDFTKIGIRPRRFFLEKYPLPPHYRENDDVFVESPISYKEETLHPFLSYYVNFDLNVYSQTIHHSKSGKKTFGEWVHPDIVGCSFTFEQWDSTVSDLSTVIDNLAVMLYSFELKRKLSFSNLRESFFQTVSNSSWANEGYLVAAEISEDPDFREELKRLSNSFGIGIIKLDITDPDSSDIIFPAETKEYLDWSAMDKLSRMNPDFKKFLNRVKNDIKSKEIRKEEYDKILTKEDLIKSILKK